MAGSLRISVRHAENPLARPIPAPVAHAIIVSDGVCLGTYVILPRFRLRLAAFKVAGGGAPLDGRTNSSETATPSVSARRPEGRLSGWLVGVRARSCRSDPRPHRKPIAPAEYRAGRGSGAHCKPQAHELSCPKAAISVVIKTLAITRLKRLSDWCIWVPPYRLSERYWGGSHKHGMSTSSNLRRAQVF